MRAKVISKLEAAKEEYQNIVNQIQEVRVELERLDKLGSELVNKANAVNGRVETLQELVNEIDVASMQEDVRLVCDEEVVVIDEEV